jgi:hypothetical protein
MADASNEVAKPLTAADLLKSNHPLHNAFLEHLGDKPATKRQARKFLQANPAYRRTQNA